MNEDYRMAILQDRYDSSHEADDPVEVDEDADMDYREWTDWLTRYRAWQEGRQW